MTCPSRFPSEQSARDRFFTFRGMSKRGYTKPALNYSQFIQQLKDRVMSIRQRIPRSPQ